MIHSLNTNKIIKDSAEKSNLFFTVSLLLLKTAKTGLIIRRRLQWQPNLLPFLIFLFQKLLQLLHGFLDFIKTAAAGIFILIAEILEFLLKET